MRYLILFTIIFFTHQNLGAQSLEGTEWEIEKNVTLFNEVTKISYEKGSPDNLIDYSKAYIAFDSQGLYAGQNFHGQNITGNWNVNGNLLTIDGAESEIIELSENVLITSMPTYLFNIEGQLVPATSITTSRRRIRNCFGAIIHSNTDVAPLSYYADHIVSQGVVAPNNTVNYNASDYILLESGFHAKKESSFVARIIEDCPANLVVTNEQEENQVVTDLRTIPSALNSNKELNVEKNTFSLFPNPSSGLVQITYNIPEEQKIQISLYDINGRLIEIILKKNNALGLQQVSYDVSNLSPGIYVYVLKTENEIFFSEAVKN